MTRYADQGFDGRIADWLEADPVTAPPDLFRTVEAALPSIQQRRTLRLPWRNTPMSRFAILAAAALVVVAALGALAIGSQRTTPAPSTVPSIAPSAVAVPSDAPASASSVDTDTIFSSPTYGYAIPIRSDWTATPAARRWTGTDNNETNTDRIAVTGTDTTIGVASQPFPQGQSFSDWLAIFRGTTGTPLGCDGGDPATWPTVSVGGTDGVWQQLCNAAQALVVRDGRAYVFSWSNSTFDAGSHLAPSAFKALLARVTLDPGTATDQEARLPLLRGRVLLEHFGNAIDGSEADSDAHPEKRRLYLVDPNNMTASGATEFLPGEPATGKYSADVSPDGTQVAFMDYTPFSSIYVANLDGTGFRKLTPKGCGCSEWDPAFDPTGTKVVYGTRDGKASWLAIRDLATGEVTEMPGTRGPSKDGVPEAPSWSPDGTRIVFARFTWGNRDANIGRIHYWQGNPDAAVLQVVDITSGTVTDLPTKGLIPGDPHWSPDGSTILFTNAPMTIMGGDGPNQIVWLVNPDGSGLRQLAKTDGGLSQLLSANSANWTADGRVIYAGNTWALINPDGTGDRPIDPNAMDMTESAVGYVYVIHWVGTP